ncbi:MAG TPA: SEC-C metal-binding domain-containing protein [Armatimonadota bacterium]|nr:SEC-C metal-binding domain-containing protein [Armatimonadota bacterium]
MPTPDPLDELIGELGQRGFNPQDWQRVMETAARTGRSAKMILVDDPNSPEGRAANEYIRCHHLLPPDYKHMPLTEVVAACEALAVPDLPLAEQKRIVMLLAHSPGDEALAALKSYREREHDPAMTTWGRLAQQECEEGILSKRMGQPVHGLALAVSKVGRNEPCPCGSGLKFKKCCGR